ncbi:glycosyltransferase family 4 protein [Actinoplanes rectilineatus]|uniref:glycosyltransferase family 4 protein n=1 Tax=Actinoplanes rectilineatus TaxID=113571 RepID=UPI0005F2E750|nr:glycosyltransferase family 4 protein [Actinoplanes rectilineatus]
MRILHLAYEDKAQPGSGGGSVRTHEINRRLAGRHDVTVVTAGWPGCRDRVEDGVRYLHAGSGRTRARAFSYFARLPGVLRRHDADLVIEDFGAPISTIGVPRFTDVPVVAMVQWMFAAELGTKYRMPFRRVENWGLRPHRRFIAVSDDLAGQIADRVPGASVQVVPNGVDDIAFTVRSDRGRFLDPRAPLVFLGRFDILHKGLDVLLEAMTRIPDRELLIAGDGPDRARLRRMTERLGLDGRVRFLGRVEGVAKYELLASAALALIPSRFETFGMVAVEAAAAGTPIVGSDIPCLRDVIPDTVGAKVPAGDPVALAEQVNRSLREPALLARRSAAAREYARGFDWTGIAVRQEAIYEEILGATRGTDAETRRSAA